MLGDLLFRPVVVFLGADDEFDFVRALQMLQVFPAIAADFTAAWALQIHDAMDAWVNGRDIQRAAGLDQHRESVVAERRHERNRIWLKQWLPAGQLNQGQSVAADARRLSWVSDFGFRISDLKGLRQLVNPRADFAQRQLLASCEGVSCVAVGAAQ